MARISAKEAEYMELSGARKDGDCSKVEVSGGVSLELGCCDYFEPETKATKHFRCGDCEYHESKGIGNKLVKIGGK